MSLDAKTKRTTRFVAPDKPRAESEDLPLVCHQVTSTAHVTVSPKKASVVVVYNIAVWHEIVPCS